MNPIRFITRPVGNLVDAVVMPFKALFVVGLCALINSMTSPGHWWFKWVALGMGIAVLVAWARAARTLLLLALVAAAGWWVYRHHGQAARERFDDWVRRTQPQQHQLFEVLRGGQGTPGFTSSK
jgi:fatty acid desaturase